MTGYRKWSVMAIVAGMSSLFLFLGKITGSEWSSLMTASTVAFFSANLGVHVMNGIKDRK